MMSGPGSNDTEPGDQPSAALNCPGGRGDIRNNYDCYRGTLHCAVRISNLGLGGNNKSKEIT